MWVGLQERNVLGDIIQRMVWHQQEFPVEVTEMVEVVKIANNGILLQIKEVPDTYRDRPYRWDEDE